MGISTARFCVKRGVAKPLTLCRQVFFVTLGLWASGMGTNSKAAARGWNSQPLWTSKNLVTAPTVQNSRPADQPIGRIEVYSRGPFGEVSASAEREFMPSDLGRELKVGGVLFELKSMRSPDTKDPVLMVTIKAPGHTFTGNSRPAGTNRFIVRENRKLVTLVGQSPGPLADIRVRFGNGSPALPSSSKRSLNPTL